MEGKYLLKLQLFLSKWAKKSEMSEQGEGPLGSSLNGATISIGKFWFMAWMRLRKRLAETSVHEAV